MATTAVTLNGVTYFVPQPGEQGPTYDQDLTNYLVALATAFPQGGASPSSTFQALVSAGANPATAGRIRLAAADLVEWRNQANTANDVLSFDANDNINYTSGATTPVFWSGLAQQLTGQTYAEANTAAAQSIPNNTATTINFGTVVVDSDLAITTGAAWKFTVPTGKGGHYYLSANAALSAQQAGAAPGRLQLSILRNGSTLAIIYDSSQSAGVFGASSMCSGAAVFALLAGDTIAFQIFQNSGAGAGAITLAPSGTQNFVCIKRLV